MITVNKDVLEIYPELNILKKYIQDTNGIIAGGCFKNIFTKTKIKDIDIFFRDEHDLASAVAIYAHLENVTKEYENENVIGYNDNGLKIELVKKLYVDSYRNLLNIFDFTVTKAAFETNGPNDFTFAYHEKFFEHLLLKRLVIDQSLTNPINTLNRTYRYTRYGYNLCIESKVKLIEALLKTTIPENSTVQEQLRKGLYDSLD